MTIFRSEAMKYQYIGLDLSLTGSGVVVLRHHGVAVRRTLKNRLRGYERLAWIRDRVAEVVREAQEASRLPVVAVIEAMPSAPPIKHDIGELGGVVRTMLFEDGVPFALVPPPTLKKFATGAGNAPKDNVLMQVLKRWGWRWRIITRAMPTRWRGSASCCAATRTGRRRRRSWSACGRRRW